MKNAYQMNTTKNQKNLYFFNLPYALFYRNKISIFGVNNKYGNKRGSFTTVENYLQIYLDLEKPKNIFQSQRCTDNTSSNCLMISDRNDPTIYFAHR